MRNKYTIVNHKIISSEEDPLTVEMAKEYIRYTDTDKDGIIENEIASARTRIENFCDITLRPAQLMMDIGLEGYKYGDRKTLCKGFSINLYRPPVKEVIMVEKSDDDFNYEIVDEDSYLINDYRFVVTKNIEDINILNPVSLKITYDVGYEDEEFPDDLMRAWKETVTCGFHNVDGVKTDYKMKNGLPLRVAHTLDHYRNAFYEA